MATTRSPSLEFSRVGAGRSHFVPVPTGSSPTPLEDWRIKRPELKFTPSLTGEKPARGVAEDLRFRFIVQVGSLLKSLK
jgi:hypothetical protein